MATGGYLFEYFITRHCSTHINNKLLAAVRASDDGALSVDVTQYFVKNVGSKFVGFLDFSIATSSRKMKQQLFHITYAAKFHGLSRSGIDMLARIGFMMPTSTLDRGVKIAHKKNKEETK